MRKAHALLVPLVVLLLGGCGGPVADLRAVLVATPREGEYPLTVTFDARGSVGDVVEYLWSFGDEATGSGPVVEHTYARKGIYEVYLTVVDRAGGTAQAQGSIRVHSKLPQARFTLSPASDVRVGMTVTFDAGASSDPDGTVAEYRWDFGDGATRATSAPQTTHVYSAPGVYPVRLVVVDGDGDESVPFFQTLTVSPGGCCGR